MVLLDLLEVFRSVNVQHTLFPTCGHVLPFQKTHIQLRVKSKDTFPAMLESILKNRKTFFVIERKNRLIATWS
jgi:hypothetical protein